VRPAKRVVWPVGPADVDHLCIHPGGLGGGGHHGYLLDARQFNARCELRGQRAARLVQPGLDRSDGNPQFGRGLDMSQPLPVEGEHRGPLARRQRRHRRPDPPGHVGGFGLLGRTGLVVGILLWQRPGRGHPEQAAGHVQGDPRVPGAELPGGAEPVQADQGGDRSLLDDVGDRVLRAEQPPGHRHDHAPMPAGQAGEGLHVSRAGGRDQFGVADAGQSGRRISHAL
jgi:hypothetical protein